MAGIGLSIVGKGESERSNVEGRKAKDRLGKKVKKGRGRTREKRAGLEKKAGRVWGRKREKGSGAGNNAREDGEFGEESEISGDFGKKAREGRWVLLISKCTFIYWIKGGRTSG